MADVKAKWRENIKKVARKEFENSEKVRKIISNNWKTFSKEKPRKYIKPRAVQLRTKPFQAPKKLRKTQSMFSMRFSNRDGFYGQTIRDDSPNKNYVYQKRSNSQIDFEKMASYTVKQFKDSNQYVTKMAKIIHTTNDMLFQSKITHFPRKEQKKIIDPLKQNLATPTPKIQPACRPERRKVSKSRNAEKLAYKDILSYLPYKTQPESHIVTFSRRSGAPPNPPTPLPTPLPHSSLLPKAIPFPLQNPKRVKRNLCSFTPTEIKSLGEKMLSFKAKLKDLNTACLKAEGADNIPDQIPKTASPGHKLSLETD